MVITFSDNQGEIILGTIQQVFRTGDSNSSNVEFNASDFDTLSWDDNNDGISNLAELLAGSDPLMTNTDDAIPSSTLPCVRYVCAKVRYIAIALMTRCLSLHAEIIVDKRGDSIT